MQPVQETAVHILANFQLLMMIFLKQINHILNNEDKSLKIHYSFDFDKIDKIFRFHQKAGCSMTTTEGRKATQFESILVSFLAAKAAQ